MLWITRGDPAVPVGSLTCRGAQRGIFPHPARQALSCLQREAAAGRRAFHLFFFFFFTFLWPFQLPLGQLLSTAGKRSAACPFSPPRHEASQARHRRGGCSRRHPQGRDGQPRPQRGLGEGKKKQWPLLPEVGPGRRPSSFCRGFRRRRSFPALLPLPPPPAPPFRKKAAQARASLPPSRQGSGAAWGCRTGFRRVRPVALVSGHRATPHRARARSRSTAAPLLGSGWKPAENHSKPAKKPQPRAPARASRAVRQPRPRKRRLPARTGKRRVAAIRVP